MTPWCELSLLAIEQVMAVLNPSPVQAVNPQPSLSSATTLGERERFAKLAQPYQADQQLKYLHLQAEVEVLLQQLQALKQRRQGAKAYDDN